MAVYQLERDEQICQLAHRNTFDLNAVLDQVEIGRLLDRIALDRLLARMDLDDLVRRIDFDALVEQTDLGAVIAASSSGAASDVGLTLNGTATDDSELNPAALPPTVVPTWTRAHLAGSPKPQPNQRKPSLTPTIRPALPAHCPFRAYLVSSANFIRCELATVCCRASR